MAGLCTGGSAPTSKRRPFLPSQTQHSCPLSLSEPSPPSLQSHQAAPPVFFQPFSTPPPSPPKALGPPGSLGPQDLHHTTHLFPQMPSPLPEAWHSPQPFLSIFCAALAWCPHVPSPRPALSSHQHLPMCQPLPLHPGLSFPQAHSMTSRRQGARGSLVPPANTCQHSPLFVGNTS